MTRLAPEVVESSRQPEQTKRLAWARSPQAITIYCYIVGAFYVTSRLWTDPASLRQQGDIQDVNQATWFVRYAADAVRHFHLPALLSTAMDAPHGVNLMWNTSLLLPGIVVSPITWLFGPQVALTSILTIAFAGSAIAMFYVLRHWNVSLLAAALGGALYGFSPALVNSGIGHYSLVIAILPPLMIDRLLRIVTGQGKPWRNGLWLGLLAAGQLFISEELLVDTVIAAVIVLVVLAICRPHDVLKRVPPSVAGLAVAAVVGLVLGAKGLWVQFHGTKAKSAAATVIISYAHHLTNLGTLPYAFINPSASVILHTSGTEYVANHYPQPTPEYLAYLGIPMIILLLVTIVYFWRNLTIRVAGITCILLEWLGMGAQPIRHGLITLPKFLLPWQYLQHLPVIGGMVPDRLAILADLCAAVVLAFALDLARSGKVPLFANMQNGGRVAAGVAIFALVFLLPTPYIPVRVNTLPSGWQKTFAALHVSAKTRVLLAPFPTSGASQMMRFQADSNEPQTMIGGDFIAPNEPGRLGRAGRAAITPTTCYMNELWSNDPNVTAPSSAQIKTDLATMQPQVVVAVTATSTAMGKFLVSLFGAPDTHFGRVLGWRMKPGQIGPAPKVSTRPGQPQTTYVCKAATS